MRLKRLLARAVRVLSDVEGALRGAAFADFELRIALATLVRNFDVRLHSPTSPEPVRRNITMCPADGIRVTLTLRHAADAA